MTQEALRNWGNIFLNGYFLTALQDSHLEPKQKAMMEYFWNNSQQPVAFYFFHKKAPPQKIEYVPKRPLLPLKKKETNYCVIL